MIYPLFLVVASIAAVSIFMVLVVPRLTKVFIQNNLPLPWNTKLIINLSEIITNNSAAIFAVVIAFIFFFLWFKNKRRVQMAISEIYFRIPIVSSLYKKTVLARFVRTLGTLLSSGIGILKALDIASEALGHNRYRKTVEELKSEVRQGVSLSNALRKKQNIFPYLIINMVNVGEKTGKLDSTLNELANFYEEEIDYSLKNFVSLIEPVLLLFIGATVAIIALSIIMPMYQLMGSIK